MSDTTSDREGIVGKLCHVHFIFEKLMCNLLLQATLSERQSLGNFRLPALTACVALSSSAVRALCLQRGRRFAKQKLSR